jgi:hypothetical protein
MNRFYTIFIIAMAALAFISWGGTLQTITPQKEAYDFLKDVRQGNLSRTVKHFGGNTCRCPAKGGWGSYLVFASGQEANLAALVGHPFNIGVASVTYIKGDQKSAFLLPWEKAEDTIVEVPIDFDLHEYAPYFLPIPLAYGKDMSYSDLLSFVNDPVTDAWKGFSLRLRPALQPGAIKPDEKTISSESRMEFRALQELFDGSSKAASKDRLERPKVDQDYIKKALGENAPEFITPKDCGNVLKDGKVLPIDFVASVLPRLRSTVLKLHVVRTGQIDQWTIFHFAFTHTVVFERNGNRLFKLQGDQN